jgi:predicted PurR-regulated permease PerM
VILDSLFLDDTLAAMWSYVAFYLSLLAMIVVPILVALFAGVLIQYTFRLIRRRFVERANVSRQGELRANGRV